MQEAEEVAKKASVHYQKGRLQEAQFCYMLTTQILSFAIANERDPGRRTWMLQQASEYRKIADQISNQIQIYSNNAPPMRPSPTLNPSAGAAAPSFPTMSGFPAGPSPQQYTQTVSQFSQPIQAGPPSSVAVSFSTPPLQQNNQMLSGSFPMMQQTFVPNPKHDAMQRAIELITAAQREQQNERFQIALNLYYEGLQIMNNLYNTETDAEIKLQLKSKIAIMLDKAEQVKGRLRRDPKWLISPSAKPFFEQGEKEQSRANTAHDMGNTKEAHFYFKNAVEAFQQALAREGNAVVRKEIVGRISVCQLKVEQLQHYTVSGQVARPVQFGLRPGQSYVPPSETTWAERIASLADSTTMEGRSGRILDQQLNPNAFHSASTPSDQYFKNTRI